MSQVQTKNKIYKSPMQKLVKFFEQSRDQWKAKCLEAKALVRQLKNKVNQLETSRTLWKNKVVALKAELAERDKKEHDLQVQLEELKKKEAALIKSQSKVEIESFNTTPSRHTYSLGYIMLFLEFVLKGSVSLRGASRCLEIINSFFQLLGPTPSYYSGRMWLIRLGYYKLTRAKEHALDWIWIIDHTIQIGHIKCLVIFGIRLCNLPQPGCCLKHEDMEPITLLPVTKSNGQVVYEQLEETIKKTGVPIEIVGDHASDLKTGIDEFCQVHPNTCHIYDIKHKGAAILKRELKHDELWEEFTKLATQTKNQLQQTPLAFLAPRKQKTKARYMNVNELTKWGRNILNFLEEQEQNPNPKFDHTKITEKLGWITQFQTSLTQWEELFYVVTITEDFVRTQGIYYNCMVDLSFLLPFDSVRCQTNRVIDELLDFVSQESKKCQSSSRRLLGSSEVLESAFGKQKNLERQQSQSGFTDLMLAIAAMVSITTDKVVQAALETVSTADVIRWYKETFGPSVQVQRNEFLPANKNKEEKRDQSNTQAIPT